jgi:hypothetical protein
MLEHGNGDILFDLFFNPRELGPPPVKAEVDVLHAWGGLRK